MAGIPTFMATFLLLSTLKLAISEIYTVGDSSKWAPGVNYTSWAFTKTFHIGDTVVFQYNNQSDNVLRVTKPDYHSCNTSFPIAVYTSGNDSMLLVGKAIGMNGRAHRFFISGIAGHCEGGEKVDIRILAGSSAISPALPPSNTAKNASSKLKLGFYQLFHVSLIAVVVSGMLGL